MKFIFTILLSLLVLIPHSFAGKRILFIGDSVTDGGWGRSGGSALASSKRNLSDLNHIYGHSYMMLCAAYYESEYPDSDYHFFNRGISGDDLQRIEKRCKEDIIDMKPDVLSVLVGVNDVFYHIKNHPEAPFDFSSWEKRFRNLLDSVRHYNPEVKLMLGTPFVAKVGFIESDEEFSKYNGLICKLKDIVCRIAKDYTAVVVDYNNLFSSLGGKGKHWIWDGVHPTAAGHKKMADLWISVCKDCGYLD